MISVLTCVRNQAPSIFVECAQSVVNQTVDLEWIVVDDGSTPNALRMHQSVVRSVSDRIPALFVSLERRIGLAAARNFGLSKASGDWVIVLDSDDRLHPDTGELLVQQSQDIQLACFEVNYFDTDQSEYRRVRFFEEMFRVSAKTCLDPFFWYDFYYHGLIARRAVFDRIGGYNPILDVGEDQDVLLRAVDMLNVAEIGFIHQVGYEYRKNPLGVCSTHWRRVLANYTKTMARQIRRHSKLLKKCRLRRAVEIDGAIVDEYEYSTADGRWYDRESWMRQCHASQTSRRDWA